MRFNGRIATPDEFPILTMIEGFARIDEHYLRAHPDTPGIYDSGVRYEREGTPEQWYDVPNIIERGADDCEGLAAWRVAELRIAGYRADPVLKRFERRDGSNLYHVLAEVQTPDGARLDDPSARLGMFDRSSRVSGVPRHLWKPLPRSTAPRVTRRRDSPTELVRLVTLHREDGNRYSTRGGWEGRELRTAVAGDVRRGEHLELRVGGITSTLHLVPVISERPRPVPAGADGRRDRRGED